MVAVILVVQHLRSHVAGRARSVLAVVGPENASDSEISDFEITTFAEHQVFRFDIPMNDFVLVNVF